MPRSNSGRRSGNSKTKARNTKTGSNALGIQRKINDDYVKLARDYRKLGIELWRKPATKFVLGGLSLAAVTPFLSRFFKQLPDMEIREKFDDIKNRAVNLVNSSHESDSVDSTI